MKATLEFTLPEERTEHLQATQAHHAWGLLHNLDCELRNLVKHGGTFATPEELAAHLRTEIWEVLQLLEP